MHIDFSERWILNALKFKPKWLGTQNCSQHLDLSKHKYVQDSDNISEVLHSEIRQKDSARGSEVENAHEDSECLFGKSSLCRKYFSDAFSCRRALARDLFKEVSYLGIASQASLAA